MITRPKRWASLRLWGMLGFEEPQVFHANRKQSFTKLGFSCQKPARRPGVRHNQFDQLGESLRGTGSSFWPRSSAQRQSVRVKTQLLQGPAGFSLPSSRLGFAFCISPLFSGPVKIFTSGCVAPGMALTPSPAPPQARSHYPRLASLCPQLRDLLLSWEEPS